jgi:hemoglobin-like flavoprotein
MNERDLELFNDSMERCSSRSNFLNRFYAAFLASSDEVAKKFEHTNLKKQARMLKISLYIMMMTGHDAGPAAQLEQLAQRHSRAELDIRPELYDIWLDRLLQTVREVDPKFDAPTEAAWRRALQPGIDFMKSRY